MGEYEQSQRLHEQSLAISREVGENRGIAFTLNNLGRLAYDKKEFSEAEQLQQQSFEAFEQLGHKQGIATALCHLGYAISASARHRHAEAGQYFRQALKLAMEIGAAPVALDALAGYAQLQATGQASKFGREQAIALLSLVQRHPASEQETKDKTQRVMSILASSLTPEVMAKTQDRNQAKTLDAVVMEVLDHNELDHEGGARPRKENTG
jgi:tetratricopeptide (TPR) repeat protein